MPPKKSVNLNYEQLLIWKENPTINPKTGKQIKENGPTYQDIEKRYNKIMEKYTEEECKKWITNKTVNPKTGRTIKPDKVVYERIRNSCETLLPQPSQQLVAAKEIEYNEDIQENIVENSQNLSIFQRILGSCKTCTLNLANNIITVLGCVDKKCMYKGCPWKGVYGINLLRIPKVLKSFVLAIIVRYINVDRCCCVCFGHLLMTFMIIFNKIQMARLDPLTKESIKIQKLIDKIDASTDLNKTTASLTAAEANKHMNNFIWKSLSNPKQAITKIISYAYMTKTEPQRIAFVSNVEELQDQLLEDDD